MSNNKKIDINKILPIVFIIFLSLICCFSYFSNQLYVGHDTQFHMNRIVGVKEAFQDRQFLPKIYPYTNNGYGYASPLFYCDLFVYPFALLYYFKVPLVITYKMMLSFYSILTIIIVFVLSKKVFDKKGFPYFATTLYCLCNYRLYDVYARSSFGEIFALVFIPIVIYAVYRMTILKENNYILLGVGFGFLALSHNITFAFYCFIFGTYMLFHFVYVYKRDKDSKEIKRLVINIVKAMIIALLLTAWFFIPMIEQFMDQKFLVNQVGLMYDLSGRTVSLSAIFSPFAILDDGNNIDHLINFGSILLFMPLLYFTLGKNKRNAHILFLIFIAYLLVLMTAGIIPIYKIKALTFMQFLFRLYIIIYPLLAIVCLYIFANISDSFSKIILVISLVYSIFNCVSIQIETMQNKLQINNSDTREVLYDFKNEKHRDHNGLEISAGEYLPTTEKVDYLDETTFIKEVSQDGYLDIVYEYDRRFTEITFTYDNEDKKKMIMLPQTYYKGYQAYEIIDGKKVPIETFSVPEYKKVGFYAEIGEHTYTSRYVGTFAQHISLAVSALAAIALTVCVCLKNKKIKLQ